MKVPVLLGIVAACMLGLSAAIAQAASQSGAAPTKADLQLHSYLQQAAEAMHKGDLASATESLRRALEIDPHSLAALNNLGIVLAREGRPAEAIPLYEEALKVRPGDPSTKRNLAVAHFKAQHYPLRMASAPTHDGGLSHRLSDPRFVGTLPVCA